LNMSESNANMNSLAGNSVAAVVCRQPLLGKHYSKYSFCKILFYFPKAFSL
jgi:hypothetical protein